MGAANVARERSLPNGTILWGHGRGSKMQYFVRTIERQKENRGWRGATDLGILGRLYPEPEFLALGGAMDEAKWSVLESDRAIMLQAEACSRNRDQARPTSWPCRRRTSLRATSPAS